MSASGGAAESDKRTECEHDAIRVLFERGTHVLVHVHTRKHVHVSMRREHRGSVVLCRSTREHSPPSGPQLVCCAWPCVLERTCAAERAAVRARPALLALAARNGGRAFTKSALMHWFALTSCEADTLPRSMHARTRPGGGFYFLYHDSAFGGAVALLSARRSTWAKRRASRQPVQRSIARATCLVNQLTTK